MSILWIDSEASLRKKYETAWRDVSISDNAESQCHAKCWLTYRAVDGDISHDDWIAHVRVNKTSPSTRWRASQAMAEFFLNVIHGVDWLPQWRIIQESRQQKDAQPHYMRAASVVALQMAACGDDHGCEDLIQDAIGGWNPSGGDLIGNPQRAWDMYADTDAARFMLWLLHHKRDEFSFVRKWLPKFMKNSRNSPWWRCVERVAFNHGFQLAQKPKVIFGDPSRNELVNRFSGKCGVELGVASGEFSSLIESQALWFVGVDKWNDHHSVAEYLSASKRLSSKLLRCSFSEARQFFEDEALDFIYIDGYAHTGQEGGRTLEEWWPKLKVGGIFSGHDYDHKFSPTVDAVDAFALKHGVEISVTREFRLPSWYFWKKNGLNSP